MKRIPTPEQLERDIQKLINTNPTYAGKTVEEVADLIHDLDADAVVDLLDLCAAETKKKKRRGVPKVGDANFETDEPEFEFRIAESLSGLPTINSWELCDLQGNLKELSETNYIRMRNSIELRGFLIPLFVWFDPADGKPYTLDGNQRLRFIRRRFPDGIELPYVRIDAADKHEAKATILLISSQYGEVTKDGWDEFMVGTNISEDFLDANTTFSNWLDMEESVVEEQPETPEPYPYKFEVLCTNEESMQILKERLMEEGVVCR